MQIAIAIAILIVLATLYLAYSYRAPNLSQYDLPRAPLVIEEQEVSDAHNEVVSRIQAFIAASDDKASITIQRQNMEELMESAVPATIMPVDVNGIPGEWVIADGANPGKRLLYLHGGGFRLGSPKSHRHITYELSKRAGVAVLAVDYRMQPEYKTVACHEDARKAYRWVLEHGPNGPEPIKSLYIAGDSAGGNLSLSVIAWARDAGVRPAEAVVAFAPVTDLTMTNPSWRLNIPTDPFLGPLITPLSKLPRWVLALVTRNTTGKPINHPEISPLLGNLANLPPTLIQVSRDEVLFDDAQRYANRANHQGSDVELNVWPKLVHVFQAFKELPESGAALQLAADFITAR